MGEVVNVAFRVWDWAEAYTQSGIAATASVTACLDDRCDCEVVQTTDVHFKRMKNPVQISELREK